MGYEKPSTKLTFYKVFFSTQWKFFIHTILHSLSAKRTSWNEFSSAMASALICLSSKKVFANMRRVGKGFSGVETPLFENMLAVRAVDAEEEVVPPTPTSPLPSSLVIPSTPPHQSPSPPPPQATEGSSHLVQQVLDTCSAFIIRVEGLETANVAQQLEIIKLKARVKKLERLNKVKSSKLRCLKKFGTSQRVESSEDEENVLKIAAAPATRKIKGVVIRDPEEELHVDTPVETPTMKDKGKGTLDRDEPEDTEVQEAVEVVTTTKLITEVVTTAATQVVAASVPIPAAKPKVLKIAAAPVTRKRKGVVIRDLEEELHVDTPAETPTVKDKGKRYHGFKKKPQSESEARKNMISYLKNTERFKMEFFKGKTYDQILPIFQARFDANMKFLIKSREEMEKEDEEIIKSINETHAQKAAKRRKLSKEAQEADNLRGRLEIIPDEDDDVFVEAIPLAQKVPVVDYQVVVIDNKPRYKIIRADDTHQLYISFTTLLKNFDREDLEALWRIVKDRFSTKKPTNFSYEYLLLTLKTMFGELDEQDPIWRNQTSVHGLALVKRWKLMTSCGVHVIILSTVQLFLLVKRRYPLSRFTLEQLVNVARLQVEEESEMSLELL
nr:hypothetical protein [Tanacetum cinerariifolium]